MEKEQGDALALPMGQCKAKLYFGPSVLAKVKQQV